MAITMITRQVAVRRERVEEWPIFGNLALPEDFAAVSVEVTRAPDQAIDRSIGAAAAILEKSLGALGLVEQHKLWLVVAYGPIKRTDRVAAYRAGRDRIWGVLERQEIVFPPGPRSGLEVPLPGDSFGLVGSVELTLGDLPAALGVTRRADAVCLATYRPVDVLPALVPVVAQRFETRESRVLAALLQMHQEWTLAARAFGQFDDSSVGVDVFSADSLLDTLQPVLVTEAGLDPGPDA